MDSCKDETFTLFGRLTHDIRRLIITRSIRPLACLRRLRELLTVSKEWNTWLCGIVERKKAHLLEARKRVINTVVDMLKLSLRGSVSLIVAGTPPLKLRFKQYHGDVHVTNSLMNLGIKAPLEEYPFIWSEMFPKTYKILSLDNFVSSIQKLLERTSRHLYLLSLEVPLTQSIPKMDSKPLRYLMEKSEKSKECRIFHVVLLTEYFKFTRRLVPLIST